MSAASVFKNFSNLGKKKKGKKKKPVFMTPEDIRRQVLFGIKTILIDIWGVGEWPDLRRRFGMDRTVEVIRNLRDQWGDEILKPWVCEHIYPKKDIHGHNAIGALITILRKYIPDDTVVNIIYRPDIGFVILRNQQGNWLPQSVSLAMNEEIQAVAKEYVKNFQKQFLIEAFKKGKSQDGEWSMRRESAIRTLQNSKPIIEIRKRVNAPGGPGQEVARLSHAAAQEAAAQENPSSPSQGGRRRKKTRRKKKRKRKSHRRRKSKKRKTKSRKN